jgi:YD repeat-containing protein
MRKINLFLLIFSCLLLFQENSLAQSTCMPSAKIFKRTDSCGIASSLASVPFASHTDVVTAAFSKTKDQYPQCVYTLTQEQESRVDYNVMCNGIPSYWNGSGATLVITLPDTSTIHYTYDDAHRLTDIADSLGNMIHYTLNAMGNRLNEQVKDPVGTLARQTTRIYDALNRLQQVTGAAQ